MREKRSGTRKVRLAVLWLSVAALALGALPLYLIAPYNHPYYDDYGFSAGVHQVWKETGSLGAVLSAAIEGARNVRQTWQGTYTGTILTNLQPGLFSEKLYGLSSVFLLTTFIVCFVYALCVFFRELGMDKIGRVSLACLATAVMLQFMPDAGEAFYWFNGGVGNTFIYSLLMLSFALSVRLARTKGRGVGYTFALGVLMVLLGGGSYGGGLFGLCAYALWTAWLFSKRHGRRWYFLGLTALFLVCFAYSMSAPGNGVRADVIGYQGSAVKAVLQALYHGTAQIGTYLRLPLIAVTLMLLPAIVEAARQSAYGFRHPWLVAGGMWALYCTQLVPPLYSIAGIGAGRIVNTYFESFVVMWFLLVYYLAGHAVRRLEGRTAGELGAKGYRALTLAGLCLLMVGCLACKPTGEALYGVQNLHGASAAISLLTGEARQYDREMTERERLLNDDTQPVVTLRPLGAVPKVFMDDLLTPGASENVRPSLCLYYGKKAIIIEGEDEP